MKNEFDLKVGKASGSGLVWFLSHLLHPNYILTTIVVHGESPKMSHIDGKDQG